MIYNFLSVYGIYYPSGTIETRVKWRIYKYYHVPTLYPTRRNSSVSYHATAAVGSINNGNSVVQSTQ